MSQSSSSHRLTSVDTLRGFDMMWIMGAEEVIAPLGLWLGWSFRDKLNQQFQHVGWDGFRFYDLIFPLFLFLLGVVLPMSLDKYREGNLPTARVWWRVVRRTFLLIFLGVIYNNLSTVNATLSDWQNLRWTGVLARMGVGYFFAALIVLMFGWRGQLHAMLLILLGYWGLLHFVRSPEPVPEVLYPEGLPVQYTMQGSLAGYVDRHFLPGKLNPNYYGYKGVAYGDNEGLLSMIPAIATALLGALAGRCLVSSLSGGQKFLRLFLSGVLCLAAGYGWGQWFPIIKNLWTSSFVLVAGGYSLLLLSLFYLVIDVWQFRKWTTFFVVIGANSIVAYMMGAFVNFEKLTHFLIGGFLHSIQEHPRLVAMATTAFLIKWSVLWYLHRRQVHLRA